MRFFITFFKNHFLLKVILWLLIDLTTRGPLYTCLVLYDDFEREQWAKVVHVFHNHSKLKRWLMYLKYIYIIIRYSFIYFSGSKTNKRCVLLDEPAEPSNTGWENNHLCVPQDSPYHFTWSHQGRIEGLDCLKLKVETDPHSWNDNFLCGWQSCKYMLG